MSLTFEIAEWRFELTLDGIACQPVQQRNLEDISKWGTAEWVDSQSYNAKASVAESIQKEEANCYELN
jgi:hypothetical protein